MRSYQDIYGLVDGAFGNNVFDPSFIHVHGPSVFKDGSCCMEVLGTIQLVGAVKVEVSCLVGHSWNARKVGKFGQIAKKGEYLFCGSLFTSLFIEMVFY